jgi:hypothetical protein
VSRQQLHGIWYKGLDWIVIDTPLLQMINLWPGHFCCLNKKEMDLFTYEFSAEFIETSCDIRTSRSMGNFRLEHAGPCT